MCLTRGWLECKPTFADGLVVTWISFGQLDQEGSVNQIQNLQICFSWFCMDYQSSGKSRTRLFHYHLVQFCCADQSCWHTVSLTDFFSFTISQLIWEGWQSFEKTLQSISILYFASSNCMFFIFTWTQKCIKLYFNPNFNFHN